MKARWVSPLSRRGQVLIDRGGHLLDGRECLARGLQPGQAAGEAVRERRALEPG
jgi:hypothetical protein